ncbi:hypothetical protein Tco_0346636 [Tanacetum coccineum]
MIIKREEFEAYLASDLFPPGNSDPSSLLLLFHNSLSGSTTSSSPSLHISETSDYFLEEFADELAHITFPPGNDDLPFDFESDLRELEYFICLTMILSRIWILFSKIRLMKILLMTIVTPPNGA